MPKNTQDRRPSKRFTRDQRVEAAKAYREAIASGVIGAGAAVARRLGIPQPNLATWSSSSLEGRPHSPEVRAAVLVDYTAGELTLREIADKHGVGLRRATHWANEDGLELRTRGSRPGRRRGAPVNRQSPEVRAAVAADYAAGMAITDIAVKHGVGQGTVTPYAREAGLPLRGRGSGPKTRRTAKPGQNGRAAAIASMNTALRQMNGKLPPPVVTQRPVTSAGPADRGLIGSAVDELARRLKIRGARLTKLEYDGNGYVVTYEVTERFETET